MQLKLYKKPKLKIHGDITELTKGTRAGRGESNSHAKSIT